MIDTGTISGTLAWINIACWGGCFWWMYHISARQNSLMKELHEMTARIESLSKEEHDLIREVHPVVGEIKESLEEVSDAVTDRGVEHERPR